MMDRLEADQEQALADSEAAVLHREGDLLAMTFKSDFVFASNSAEVHRGLRPEMQCISHVMVNYPQTYDTY